MNSITRERIKLNDLLHFTPKQLEAKQAAKRYKYLLYGGAMFGGKSYWLRWMLVFFLVQWAKRGLTKVEVGLFCENYPTLKDRQLSKIGKEFPDWLGQFHSDHKVHGRCFILSEEYGGGIIKFRNLDDVSKYQSAEFAAIAVDELTKNAEEVFEDLRHRLRWVGISDVHFIAGTNPGGIGHAWVKKRWLDRQFEEEESEKDQFFYVRALLTDNPYREKNYEKQLESLPTDKRRAYLEGDWDIFKGQYFTEFRREVHVVNPFEIPFEWKRIIGGDQGFARPSVALWGAVSPDNQLYLYRELHQSGLSYSQLADRIHAMTPPHEKISYIVFDPAIWAQKGENDAGLSGAEIILNRWREIKAPSFNLIQGDNDRLSGWATVREYLKPYHKENALTAKLQIFSTCAELIRTVPSLVYDEHRVEDLDSDGEDDAADALRYLVKSRLTPAVTKEQLAQRDFDAMMKKRNRNQKFKRQRLFVK